MARPPPPSSGQLSTPLSITYPSAAREHVAPRFSPRCDALPEHRGLPPLRARSSGDGLDRKPLVSRGRVEGDFPIGHKRASRAPAAPHQLFPPPSRPAFFSILDSGFWSAPPPKDFRAVLTCPALGKVFIPRKAGSLAYDARRRRQTVRPVRSACRSRSAQAAHHGSDAERVGGCARTGTGPAHGAFARPRLWAIAMPGSLAPAGLALAEGGGAPGRPYVTSEGALTHRCRRCADEALGGVVTLRARAPSPALASLEARTYVCMSPRPPKRRCPPRCQWARGRTPACAAASWQPPGALPGHCGEAGAAACAGDARRTGGCAGKGGEGVRVATEIARKRPRDGLETCAYWRSCRPAVLSLPFQLGGG